MDVRTPLIRKVIDDLQKTHTEILQTFPHCSTSIPDILLQAKIIHDLLLIKTDTTAILLREVYGYSDFKPIHNIYRHSLTTLLLTINFKIQARITKLALLLANGNILTPDDLRTI